MADKQPTQAERIEVLEEKVEAQGALIDKLVEAMALADPTLIAAALAK